jgi:hypothetical protein
MPSALLRKRIGYGLPRFPTALLPQRSCDADVVANRNYKGDTISAKLRLCDNRSVRRAREQILRVLRELRG